MLTVAKGDFDKLEILPLDDIVLDVELDEKLGFPKLLIDIVLEPPPLIEPLAELPLDEPLEELEFDDTEALGALEPKPP